MAEDKTLFLKIQADLSQASKEIRRLQKELKSVGDESEKSASKMKKGMRGALDSASQMDAAYKKVGNAIKGVGQNAEKMFQKLASVQGVITGALIKGFNDMAIAEEKLRMQTQALRANPAFGGIQKDFENISNLTGGLVNDFEMVSGVSKAMAFGLDLSNGRLAEMIKGAQKASIAMGTDLGKAFEDLSIAAGRQSRLIADNLGIVMSVSEANENFAASLGITTDELTEQQKKTAFLEEMLNKLNKAYSHIETKNFDTRVQKNTKTIEKFAKDLKGYGTDLLAGLITDGNEIGSRVADIFDFGISGAHKMWKEQENLAAQTKETAERYKEWFDEMELANEALDLGYDSLDQYKAVMDETAEAISKAKKEQAEFSAMVRGVPVPTGVAGPKIILTKKGRAIEKRRREKEEREEKRAREKAAKDAARVRNKIALLNAEVRQRAELGTLKERRKIEIMYEKDIALEKNDIKRQALELEKEQALQAFDEKAKAKEDALKREKEREKELEKERLRELEEIRKQDEANLVERSKEAVKAMSDRLENAGKEDARVFQSIAGTSLGLIKQMATEGADAVLLSVADMAAGFAWSAGSQMVADGIAQNAKAAIVSTWPFVGPLLAAPMFTTANSAIAGGLGLMAAGGLGSFMTAKAGATSGSASAGAQERNTEAEKQDMTIYVQSSLYPNKTEFQKQFKKNGVLIKT